MIVLSTIAAAAALLLVASGADHLLDPTALARALAEQGLERVLAARSTARAVAVAELLVGTSVLAALLLGTPVLRWVLLAQGLLYLGFLASLLVRYRRGDRSDCGCSNRPSLVGPAGMARAAGLAVISGLAAVTYPAVALPALDLTGVGIALLLAGGAVLTVLLHSLPAAIDGVPPSALQRGAG
ncbi:MAG: MauE/DoxX family redox-associated membrane protein [Pseudonocardiaceae bacterium]